MEHYTIPPAPTFLIQEKNDLTKRVEILERQVSELVDKIVDIATYCYRVK